MGELIDTNLISEVRKVGRCDTRVSAWYASIADTAFDGRVLGIDNAVSARRRRHKRLQANCRDHGDT